MHFGNQLWFDVGIKRYTTPRSLGQKAVSLWFDVGIKRYTTQRQTKTEDPRLWFDVGIKRYTTLNKEFEDAESCGLM